MVFFVHILHKFHLFGLLPCMLLSIQIRFRIPPPLLFKNKRKCSKNSKVSTFGIRKSWNMCIIVLWYSIIYGHNLTKSKIVLGIPKENLLKCIFTVGERKKIELNHPLLSSSSTALISCFWSSSTFLISCSCAPLNISKDFLGRRFDEAVQFFSNGAWAYTCVQWSSEALNWLFSSLTTA